MVILEWNKPGIWLDSLEKDDAWRLEGQIRRLEDALIEANVTLNMFEEHAMNDRAMEIAKEEFEVRREISRSVEAEMFPDGMMQMGAPEENPRLIYEERRAIVEVDGRHQMWQRGFLPRSHTGKPSFIFAKAFVHALDLFDKFLDDIAKDSAAPEGIRSIHEKLCEALPDLREVRNSIQHAEDRSKGMHRKNKIELKKIDTSKISIDGTALVNMGLNGNKFGTTMADGHYGAIEVSVQTVGILRSALLEVYSLFAWKGPQRPQPD